MKKWLLAFALLTALSVGLTVTAGLYIAASTEDVTFAEDIRAGQKPDLTGLKVFYTADLQDTYYWDSVFTPQGCVTQTSFSCEYDRTPEFGETEYSGVRLESGVHEVLISAPRDYDGTFATLAKVSWDLKDSVAPGETKELTIRLRDYCEYYPVSVVLDLPGGYWHCSVVYDSMGGAIAEAFSDFFRIPVLPGEYYSLSFGKGANGYVSSSGGGNAGDEYFDFSWCGVCTEGLCYFTFQPRSHMDKVMDTSLIPDGFGIYAMPYTTDDSGKAVPQPKDLRNAYPLDPETRILSIAVSRDEKKLLLVTSLRGDTSLTVLDIATAELLQQFTLTRGEDRWGQELIMTEEEDCLVLRIAREELAVLTMGEDGLYTHRFTVREVHEEHHLRYGYGGYAWKDGLLAVAYYPEELGGLPVDAHQTCGFALAVYDETGLRFDATYLSSLEYTERVRGEYNGCNPFTPFKRYPISWE